MPPRCNSASSPTGSSTCPRPSPTSTRITRVFSSICSTHTDASAAADGSGRARPCSASRRGRGSSPISSSCRATTSRIGREGRPGRRDPLALDAVPRPGPEILGLSRGGHPRNLVPGRPGQGLDRRAAGRRRVRARGDGWWPAAIGRRAGVLARRFMALGRSPAEPEALPGIDPRRAAGLMFDLDEAIRRAWPVLLEAIRQRRTVSYSELAGRAGPPLAPPAHPPAIAHAPVHALPSRRVARPRRPRRPQGFRPAGRGWFLPEMGDDPERCWAEALAECFGRRWPAEPDPVLLNPTKTANR